MYFRKSYFDEKGTPTEVELVCEKCENIITVTENIAKVFSSVKSDYCIIKDNEHIKCSCGNISSVNLVERKNIAPTKVINSQIPHQYVPKCPTCGSPNLSKISATKKAAKIAAFGIFGMGDNGKTWKCNNCGSKF